MKISNISPQTRQNQPNKQVNFGMLKITKLQPNLPIRNAEAFNNALLKKLDKILQHQKGSILYPAKEGDDLYLSTKYAHMTYHEEKLKDAFNRLIGNDRDLKNQIKFSVATEDEARKNPVPNVNTFEPPKSGLLPPQSPVILGPGTGGTTSPILGSVERITNYRAY